MARTLHTVTVVKNVARYVQIRGNYLDAPRLACDSLAILGFAFDPDALTAQAVHDVTIRYILRACAALVRQ